MSFIIHIIICSKQFNNLTLIQKRKHYFLNLKKESWSEDRALDCIQKAEWSSPRSPSLSFRFHTGILQLCWMFWSDSQNVQNHSPELDGKGSAATVVQKGKGAALILFRKQGKSNQYWHGFTRTVTAHIVSFGPIVGLNSWFTWH